MEESPEPHYIVVEESLAPQHVVVEECPAPMSCVKDRPYLVVDSPPGPTLGKTENPSLVPMSGTKDEPSPVDDSLAVPKVNNLCSEERIRWREVLQRSE